MGLAELQVGLAAPNEKCRPITHIFTIQAHDAVSNFQTCFLGRRTRTNDTYDCRNMRYPTNFPIALYFTHCALNLNLSRFAARSRKENLQVSAFPIQIEALANYGPLDH